MPHREVPAGGSAVSCRQRRSMAFRRAIIRAPHRNRVPRTGSIGRARSGHPAC